MWRYLVATTVLLLGAGMAVIAAETPKEDQTKHGDMAPAAKTSEFTPHLQRLGDLIGRDVTNPNGQKLGSIDDIVLTTDQSRVSYAALSVGGVLGIGDKLYAIPWHALKMSEDGKTITLNVDRGRLEQATGFDKKNWPEAGDEQWTAAAGETAVKDATGKSGEAIKPDESRMGHDAGKAMPMWARRITQLNGTTVRNLQGDDLGSIENVIVDTREHRTVYAILASGGVLGVGEKMVAVPWSAIELRPELKTARLDAERKTLDALAFKQGDQPDLTNREYARNLYEKFHVQPYWEVFGYVSGSSTEKGKPSTDAWKAGSDYNKHFDAKTVVTVEGVIESVGSFTPEMGAYEGIRLRVKTDQGNVATVQAGPMAYADKNGVRFNYGDRITITGSKTTVGLRSVLMATEIKVGDKTLKLRDASGAPLWNADELFGTGTLKSETMDKK